MRRHKLSHIIRLHDRKGSRFPIADTGTAREDAGLLAQANQLLVRAALKLLRSRSKDARAVTELFVEPYQSWVGWKSGLGEGAYLLYSLIRAIRPHTVVEIGSARGKSTCAIALACRHNDRGRVFAIDPQVPNTWSELETDGFNYEFLLKQLQRYGLEGWCTVIRATSEEAARGWKEPIDFLFVDGDHSYEGVRRDFVLFQPWLTPDAIIAFHDTTWDRNKTAPAYTPLMGVPQLMNQLQQQGYHSVTVLPVPGLTLLQATPGGYKFLEDAR